MRYIHWRDDFSITESFSTGQASAPVPQRVRIEYFTAKGHGRFVAERNGNTFVNCELSADGNSLVVHVSLRDRPIGHGRLLRIATVITEDASFPGGLKYSSIPDKVAAVLYFGKSDGPLDMASEIVFDGVDRLSLLEDVRLSGPDIGDLLSWNGSDWVNIPQSAVTPDLSDYVRWTELSDYVTTSELQEILADLITSDEITSLSQRITTLEHVQFFELDGNGNVKLKDEYGGLWASGWIATGGVGSGGSGGGGLIETVYTWAELQAMASAPSDDVTSAVNARGVYEIWQAVKALQNSTPNVSLVNGSGSSTITVNSVSAEFYTKGQVDNMLANIDLTDYVTNTSLESTLSNYATKNEVNTAIGNVNVLSSITTRQDGTIDFTWNNGDVVRVNLNHEHSNYVPVTRTINGIDLSQNREFYVGKSLIQSSARAQDLIGINSIKATDAATSQLVWDNDHGAWRVKGNLYADGWIAAGGIGTASASSGELGGLVDVTITSAEPGQILSYNGEFWVNVDAPSMIVDSALDPTSANPVRNSAIYNALLAKQDNLVSGTNIKTVNGVSILGSGDITVSGGSSINYVSRDTSVHIVTFEINGTNYTLCENGYSAGGGVSSESDPIFTASPAYTITSNDIQNWNAKGTISGIRMNGFSMGTSGVVDLGTVLTAHQSVVLATGTAVGTLKLTVNGVTTDNIAVNGMNNVVTLSGTQTITGAKTFSTNLAVGGSVNVNGVDSINQGNANDAYFNLGAASAKTFNAYGTVVNLRVYDSGSQVNIFSVQSDKVVCGSSIIPNYVTGLNLGGSSDNQRWGTIYGVNENLTGDILLSTTSHIDIGPLRIEYDASAEALHITKKNSSDIKNYGLYADGFIAAGGVQQTS